MNGEPNKDCFRFEMLTVESKTKLQNLPSDTSVIAALLYFFLKGSLRLENSIKASIRKATQRN
jgi:hypothetical protein